MTRLRVLVAVYLLLAGVGVASFVPLGSSPVVAIAGEQDFGEDGGDIH